MTESTGDWKIAWLDRGVKVHATAIVDDGAQIGPGSTVWHFTHIRESAVIGAECTIGQGCYVDATVSIGSRCKIANGVQIYAGATIGSGVFIGPNTTFTNDLWPRACEEDGRLKAFTNPEITCVDDGASIGAGCVILPVVIGAGAMIGAGALVAKDVPPHTRFLGVIHPALNAIHR